MFEYDPATSLQHWPTPMSKYGLNPYLQNMYRIVLASSRRHLVGGTWPNGENGYHWVPKYRNKSGWILERWYSAFEFTRCSRTQWDTTMIDPASGWPILGPYPDRGEYDLVWEFDHGVAADGLDDIIACLERARLRSFDSSREAGKADYEREDRDDRNAAQDEIRDAVTSFGNAPFASGRVSRGTKTAPDFLRSAEQLGLPIPGALGTDVRGMHVSNSLIAGGI